jgi:hypothetical protein
MTPYLQEKIEWRLYPMHGFFCACSFVVGTSHADLVDSADKTDILLLLVYFCKLVLLQPYDRALTIR